MVCFCGSLFVDFCRFSGRLWEYGLCCSLSICFLGHWDRIVCCSVTVWLGTFWVWNSLNGEIIKIKLLEIQSMFQITTIQSNIIFSVNIFNILTAED